MNCADVRKLLSEHADGMLSTTVASAVEDHIAHCPGCRDTLESMSRIMTHMNRMESVDAPDGFLERVNARIGGRSSFQKLIRRLFVPLRVKLPLELAGVAAAVLVLYVGGIRDHKNVVEISISMNIPTDSTVEKGKKGGKADHGEKRGSYQPASPEALVHSLGGTVTVSEYRQGTDLPTLLMVVISADDLPALVEGLDRLGVILESPSEYPENGGEAVTVRIDIVYPDG